MDDWLFRLVVVDAIPVAVPLFARRDESGQLHFVELNVALAKCWLLLLFEDDELTGVNVIILAADVAVLLRRLFVLFAIRSKFSMDCFLLAKKPRIIE